jgi:pyruvate,water dikinase
VRVVHDPRAARVERGEILVARYTDPGWIMLFPSCSGLLVERGSLLSHSAIVAREMGIPAIVGLAGVIDWVQTGDLVELDGASGVVRKLAGDGA